MSLRQHPMSESLLPHAPSLDEPLEMLDACHDRIESQLRALERLAAHLPAHGADAQARQAANAVLRYFALAGPNHHEDEEWDLFPRLIGRAGSDEAPAVRALVDDLLAEHARMAEAVDAVRRELRPIAEGARGTLDAEVLARMAALYRRHIARETRDLLPLARRLLTPGDIAALGRAMSVRRGAR